MTSLTSGRFQPPLVLPEGDTIDFVFRWSNNGTLYTPPVTPVWIFGIKDATTPSGDFLVQVNSASANAGVYTFTVPISSAELQAWLATATSQSYAAIQITDTANGIATTPLLCQITANQNDTGTTPTSANGTLNVAAGKTVTFPLSLTFPSAAGTNGQQLTLSNSTTGLLEWAASGSGITIGTTTANGTAGQVLYTDGSLVQAYAISGTGSVAMTTSPSFTTPSLGAATATSINGVALTTGAGGAAYSLAIEGPIDTSNGGGTIDTSNFGGSIDTANGGGSINTTSAGGGIDTSVGGGSINTKGTGSIELGVTGTRTTLQGSASGGDKTQTLPNATGTITLNETISGGTLAGSFITLAVNGKSLTLGASFATTGTDLPTFAFPSAATARTYTFPTTTATLARTDAAQTFSGTQTIQAATNAGVPLIAKSFTTADGSTGNIQQWQKSDGTVVARIYGGSSTPTAGAIEAGGMIFGNTNEFWQNDQNVDGGNGGIYFNYRGYNGLDSRFRNTYFANGKYSVFLTLTGSTKALDLTGGGPASFSGTLAVTGATTLTGAVTTANFIAGVEMTAPAAPAANGYRIYAEDNGAGKTRLMVLFATGVAQQIAIEP